MWIYRDGPPVTSPRIKLRDGRHLSYLEHGVPKETAKYKIIFVHGFANSKQHNLFAAAASPVFIFHSSHALIEDLKVYTVSFDRPGYGESDPDPNRTLKNVQARPMGPSCRSPPTMADLLRQPTQQREYESLHRDLIIAFGKWEFDPMELENPFPNNEGSVHIWQGDDDRFTPVTLQRYIAQRLPWIKYHELTHAGHLFAFVDGMTDTILKTLLNEKGSMGKMAKDYVKVIKTAACANSDDKGGILVRKGLHDVWNKQTLDEETYNENVPGKDKANGAADVNENWYWNQRESHV
ncbi:hypothetical protein L1987_45893 [Smallanthus sonchifolius]|uniref:Uncharacterized protein n=1 Tax=Smallanthus sonchifolius TaxID=185202 RepID=A0ACB9FYF1_9ASTR|nr:hypothetical protein L1987_45893 [Smallanthus sonchifolius]